MAIGYKYVYKCYFVFIFVKNWQIQQSNFFRDAKCDAQRLLVNLFSL